MDRKRNDRGEIMKVLSIKAPFATLIKEGKKKQKREVGKHLIVANYIYTQVVQKYQESGRKIRPS